jgi:hypothetical protein
MTMNRRQMIFRGLVPAIGTMGLLAPAAPASLAKKSKKSKTAKKAKKKFKTVTRTYHNYAPLDLPNSGPASLYPSPIQVKGLKQGKVLDVNLILHGFSHESPDDLDMLLVAPDGSAVQFMRDAGTVTNVSDLTLTFDDQAPAPMPQFAALESKAYKPTIYSGVNLLPPPAPGFITGGSFSVFKHGKANGVWKLYINDHAANTDSGSIGGGWSLRIRARVKK